MKKLFFVFLMFICLGALSAQEPMMSFDKTSHDFGKIKMTEKVSVDFTIKNIGKAPLFLSEPKSTCGCTVASYPKEPIMPGQSSKITVTFEPEKEGPFTKQITIFSNAENSPITLVIKGEIIK
ncbi:MAG: hypothetical protein BWX61_01183 [Bacteroidetes bacterium ADurb.Bin035]|jgi:hypothetical protein|nr:MAG: hypothetical protein BWX61_01183 [Bacteroidetes bacterium ADurb.Bin035]HNT71325.1 DUF1573 domain-containing protein [Bacteroidales bacterium]HOH93575.1 DUF1573 domain-containing protein [Bacteroidales bacterium]HPM40705.1 DUF1573 domain-containing protein [Bacteroidales bacterium]HPX45530.1 DUF1573 domain-containing protein [Bacteroidales bacterium]